MNSSSGTGYRLVSSHGVAEVRQRISDSQKALFSSTSFRAGENISRFEAGTISAEPTYLTVQVGEEKHITLQPEFLQYVNHSCEPNVFFDTTSMQFTALKDIRPGDELVFFYPSTEWKMKQGFQCFCRKPGCLGEIRGAAFLPKQVLKRYRLTDFIQQKLSRKTQRKVA